MCLLVELQLLDLVDVEVKADLVVGLVDCYLLYVFRPRPLSP